MVPNLNFKGRLQYSKSPLLPAGAVGSTTYRRPWALLQRPARLLHWWVDDVLMIELDRTKKKIAPPTRSGGTSRLSRAGFDQLIYNVDRTLETW